MEPEQCEQQDASRRPWTFRFSNPDGAWRFAPPRFRDVRWVIGAILLIGGFLGGLRVIAGLDRSVTVWTVRRTMLPGEQLAPSDLTRTRVHVAGRSPSAYVGPGLPRPDQRTVRHVVAAGEFLPRSALGPAKDLGLRTVDVPLLGVSHVPESGSSAEMWVAKRSGDASAPTYEKPVRMVDQVLVGRPRPPRSSTPTGGGAPVVTVQVPTDALPAVVEAVTAKAGITLVPITSSGRP